MTKDFYLTRRKDPDKPKNQWIWYVRFRNPITRVIETAVSSHLTNRTRAEAWARDEYGKKCTDAAKPPTLLREWSAPFFQPSGCPHKEKTIDERLPFGERTRRAYLKYLQNDILSDPIADKRLVDISRADLVQYRLRIIAKHGRRKSTHFSFRVLCMLLRDAVYYGKIPYDPTALLGGVEYDKKQRIAAGLPAIKKLFSPEYWDSSVARRGAMAAVFSGLRAGEILAVRWVSLDPKKERIAVVSSRTDVDGEGLPKWGKVRVAIYPKILQRELEPFRGKDGEYVFSILAGVPLSYKTLHKHVVRAVKRAELQGLTLHGLRHSGQTILRGEGVNDELLKASYGWSNAATQELYTHRELYDLTPMAKAADKTFGGAIDG